MGATLKPLSVRLGDNTPQVLNVAHDKFSGKVRVSIAERLQAPALALFRVRGEALRVLLCVGIPLLCILVADPFSSVGFNDDWSYSHVALKFADTGRIHYNGWTPAMQLFQALWGAGWIRMFGFSFDLLRLITIPFSVGFAWLTYALGRKAGLRGDLACFGALIVGTSPLYIPLMASFMTEPYACFFTALCLYAAVRSGESATTKGAVLWLWVLVISGIFGGADRQSVWAAPLALIPYLLWIRRSEPGFRLWAIGAYLFLAATIALLVSRFTQPYPGLDLATPGDTTALLKNVLPTSGRLLSFLLASLQVAWPALLCFVPFWTTLKGLRLFAMVFASVALTVASILAGGGAVPFASSVLSGYGLLPAGADALGYRPVLLAPAVRIALGALVVFSGTFLIWGQTARPKLQRIPGAVFLISSCAYALLLVPAAITGLIHDRYVLPAVPALVIFVLYRFQASCCAIPIAAWLCLVALGAYGVVITHDYASASRARVTAAQSLETRGVPRNRISAGLEYDAWTQLQSGEKMAPIRHDEPLEWNTTDRFWFWTRTETLHPDYVVVSARASDNTDGHLPRIAFTAWTPPFRRAVVVSRREDLPKSRVCTSTLPCLP